MFFRDFSLINQTHCALDRWKPTTHTASRHIKQCFNVLQTLGMNKTYQQNSTHYGKKEHLKTK